MIKKNRKKYKQRVKINILLYYKVIYNYFKYLNYIIALDCKKIYSDSYFIYYSYIAKIYQVRKALFYLYKKKYYNFYDKYNYYETHAICWNNKFVYIKCLIFINIVVKR